MFSLHTCSIFFVSFFALASCTEFTDCDRKGSSTITTLNVTNCDGGLCELKKGTTSYFEMEFTSSEDVHAATTEVVGYIGSIPVPFMGIDTNSCHFMKCPIEAGDKRVFKLGVDIKAWYPTIDIKVQLSLVNSNNKILTCILVDAKVVDVEENTP